MEASLLERSEGQLLRYKC